MKVGRRPPGTRSPFGARVPGGLFALYRPPKIKRSFEQPYKGVKESLTAYCNAGAKAGAGTTAP